MPRESKRKFSELSRSQQNRLIKTALEKEDEMPLSSSLDSSGSSSSCENNFNVGVSRVSGIRNDQVTAPDCSPVLVNESGCCARSDMDAPTREHHRDFNNFALSGAVNASAHNEACEQNQDESRQYLFESDTEEGHNQNEPESREEHFIESDAEEIHIENIANYEETETFTPVHENLNGLRSHLVAMAEAFQLNVAYQSRGFEMLDDSIESNESFSSGTSSEVSAGSTEKEMSGVDQLREFCLKRLPDIGTDELLPIIRKICQNNEDVPKDHTELLGVPEYTVPPAVEIDGGKYSHLGVRSNLAFFKHKSVQH